MITSPKTVTAKQYEKGFFAIDKDTADHWLILSDGRRIFLGRDFDSLKNTEKAARSGSETWEVNGVDVDDENGNEVEIEAWIVPTSEAWNDLDLDALAEGRVEWM